MRKLMTNGIARFFGGLCLVFPLFAAAAMFTSCEKHENSERNESIEVYLNPLEDAEPSSTLYLGVRGGTYKLYVKSNIDFEASWEDSNSSPWVTVLDDTETDPTTGMRVVTLSLSRLSSSAIYTRRSGMLILAAKDRSLNYNKYITIHQGSTARISCTFSWLKYGDGNPSSTVEETPISSWTTTQKDYGYTSTVISGESYAYCYGKSEYVKLGDDEGHGADIITPYVTDFYRDSMLVVSFRAVAYTDPETRVQDKNKVTVEVLNGGVIADYADHGWTSMEFDVPYYDLDDESFPSNMWDDTNFLVFVKGTDTSPLSTTTQIRITAGALSKTATIITHNNRVFLDNLYVYRVVTGEEDYFTENGGSGLDYILGSTPEVEDEEE